MARVEIETIENEGRVIVIRREDGKTTLRRKVDPNSATQQTNTARLLGVDVPTLIGWLEKPGKYEPVAPHTVPAEWVVRRMEQTRAEGETKVGLTPEQVLNELLPSIPREKILDWPTLDQLCCLDIDYHDSPAPPRHVLEALVRTRVTPQPYCWHFSRGGGLHLFYVAADGFTAEELAAIAALRFRILDTTAGVELKKQVRGPGDEAVQYGDDRKQDTTGTLLEWLREPTATVEGIDEYLLEEGMELGRRYPHNKCPIHPSDDPGDKRDPVVVSESGIYCFVCAGKGRVFGSRRPGFVPWPSVLGQAVAGDVGFMVRGLCHWGHAKWVLSERYGLSGPLAELAYRAALKAYHRDKPTYDLIPGVFDPMTERYTRVGEDWMSLEELQMIKQRMEPILSRLPYTQYVDPKGAVKSDPARVAHFTQPLDLTREGYPTLQLVYGMRLAGEYLDNHDRTMVAVPGPHLKRGGKAVIPRYVPYSSRVPIEKAWDRLREIVPGVDRTLIELLLCAAGCAQETELGMPPRIFVAGPSGAAKSSHFKIAAGILGVSAEEVSIQNGEERLRQAIRDSIEQSPYVVVNEILKDSRRNAKRSPGEALQVILNLEKDSRTHVLYKGSQRFGRQFVLGMTEVALPPEIRNEQQIARRVWYYRLPSSIRVWPETMKAAGLTAFKDLRLASHDVAEACNAILSDVVDRFFAVPMTWEDQAGTLGVKTIENHADFVDQTPHLRHLFKLVCLAPEIDNTRLRLIYKNGYKQIKKNEQIGEFEEDLYAYYTMFADGPGEDWFSSRQLMEKDWSRILGTDLHVRLVMSQNGSSVFLRFQVGPEAKPERVNQQIVDPTDWETV